MGLCPYEGYLAKCCSCPRQVKYIIADAESKKFNKELEWQLNKDIFSLLLEQLNITCDIDLFASRVNKQLPKYISYRPDPDAYAVNACTIYPGQN